MENYQNDIINGIKTSPLIIHDDYVIDGLHQGSVILKSGSLVINGVVQGSLEVFDNTKAEINGNHQGSVHLGNGAVVVINGKLNGSITIERNGKVIIEKNGLLAGSIINYGEILIRGVLAGSRSGNGHIEIEDNGIIKEPKVIDGINYYEL